MTFEQILLDYFKVTPQARTMGKATERAWRIFTEHCQARELEFTNLVPRHIDDFLQALQWEPYAHRGLLYSANTVDQIMRCTRHILRWASKAGHLKQDPSRAIALPRPPQPKQHLLTWKEIQGILQAPDRTCAKGLRDAAVLAILVEANLEVDQCLALLIGQHKELALEAPTRDLVEAYLQQARPLWARPTTGKKLLFLNPYGGPLNNQTARKALKKAAELAGLSEAPSVKCLRRSYWAYIRGQSQGRLPSSFNRDL